MARVSVPTPPATPPPGGPPGPPPAGQAPPPYPQEPYPQEPGYAPQYPQQGYAHPGYGAPVLVGGHPVASPWERLLARIIDGFVLLVPSMFCAVLTVIPVALVVPAVERGDPAAETLLPVAVGAGLWFTFLAQAGLYYWYEVAYQGKHGQTVGKRVMDLRVLTISGQAPDHRAYQRRFLVAQLPLVVLAVPCLGFFLIWFASLFVFIDQISCLWDKPYRQCIHDKFADTVVVKLPA
jgi:uncharacterized RDD family membrane protein YckC